MTSRQDPTWQWHLKHAIRDLPSLAAAIDCDLDDVATDFPLLVPRPYLARIEKGNRADPLLRQVLPLAEENCIEPGYTRDPLQELALTEQRGLLHKYHGRDLIVATGHCAINCRYCFRRHFPYPSFQPAVADLDALFAAFARDPAMTEVILSGGDPLAAGDRRVADLARRAAAIPHVTTLRLHTRLPVVIPSRVTPELTRIIARSRLRTVVVVHANHANELDDEVAHAMAALQGAGATLLNQSVLLAGVNDSATALTDLSRRLFAIGVLPYYLHLLDKVQGAAHFDVDADTGRRLIASMRSRLPGYLVPRLAREVPGADAKDIVC